MAVNLSNPSASHKILSVIQAVITCWTAHYLAYCQLLDLLYTLQILARHERECNKPRIIVGGAASRRKASGMLSIIEDPLFWHTLAK